MASRKTTINYQWRLFLPLVALLWILLGIVFFWQYHREKKYRINQIEQRLSFINSRVIHAYEQGADLNKFMDFVEAYYDANPIFNNLRVSIYIDGELKEKIGEPLPYNPDDLYDSKTSKNGSDDKMIIDAEKAGFMGDEEYYYTVNHSPDGHLVVYTAMSYGDLLHEAMMNDSGMWIMLLAIGSVFTILAYVSTRYIGRTVKLLRNFADRAATDSTFVPNNSDFPPDELGEIAHTIVELYHARIEANDRMKREHRVALHSIQEKERIKRELTNNINHEIKTPIAIVRGYLETVLGDPEMDEEARTRFLTKAHENVLRLCSMMEEVSTITRLDEKGFAITTEAVDYHDIVYNVITELEDSGMAKKMQLVYNIPFNCMIEGNTALLSSMLLNLFKNAIAYSQGTQCAVEMVDETDNEYIFQMYDNGVGVPEEHLTHLFERFFRIDSGRSRRMGGTGLGLSIVYNCVKAHGGEITVANRPQGGLVFRFTLPKAKQK